MKVIDYIKQAKSALFTFEILPPLKGQDIEDLMKTIEPLMEFNPPFIDVTYHREEYVYKHKENGLLEKTVVRKRPGTVGICAALMNRFNVDAVPHIICGGFSMEETENALIDLDFLGVDNVLVLRGDPIKSEGSFIPTPNGHNYALDLLKQVINMNKGIYLDDSLSGTKETSFCVGVAGYPEKHFEAPNFNSDIKYLKKKVEAGAEYVVTQMFFDNQKYFEYVKKCRDAGIEVPIIPGIKPITTKKHLNTLPRAFYVDLPDDLVDEIEKCKSNEDVKAVGTAWTIAQCKELLEFGVPSLHFYTMSRGEVVYNIAKELY